MTLLEAADIAFGYPGREIGRDLSVHLAAGEALALLGPNGGGKTTLLKTLLGLLPALAGTIRVEDRSLGDLTARERAQAMAYVPQAGASAFAFTARAVVLMGRTSRTGLLSAPSRAAWRGALTTTAAAPSETRQQSSSLSGAAMVRDFITSSTLIGSRMCACGCNAA